MRALRIARGGNLEDPTGTWHELYGVSLSGAVLVRPDGHVGWRSADHVADPAAALDAALDRLTANARESQERGGSVVPAPVPGYQAACLELRFRRATTAG